ncbi:MAG TPA: two-component regulator propeller domain-containing protein [Candidatus Hydrogenedentes bacterium]|nr:two-component regulator propeller domain-containing protein [Candidatus Hydrogenedentota bacterium]
MRWVFALVVCVSSMAEIITPAQKSELLGAAPPLDNVLPALEFPDHKMRDPKTAKPWELPIAVPPFEEHVRGAILPAIEGITATWVHVKPDGTVSAGAVDDVDTTVPYALEGGNWKKQDKSAYVLLAKTGDGTWIADSNGLSHAPADSKKFEPIRHYGVNGPLSTSITGLAKDSKDTLWVGTPIGLSKRTADGTWTGIRGPQGLPYEDITCLAVDKNDRLWIGTSFGVVHYRPYEEGRQWFYRQGKRYLPDDKVTGIAVSPDANTVYIATPSGIGTIEVKTTTLLARAQTIEKLVNERHRRLGMVAACVLDNAENPTSHTIGDNDNDGLWTAYHVAAMSLAYGATKDESAKASAKEGMHALYMLQNASGIPGLPARSVVFPDEGVKKDPDRPADKKQWRPTPDGKMYWKSDTSSDEIDGHFMAFYTYFEHIAKNDPAEKELCIKQCRELIDYIVDNNYQLIDWDGERTRWGFWNPEALNGDPGDYIENGLNALQILSFLRTSHYITGDAKYLDHYEKLIMDHHYLSNVLTSKKEWPDENNHSDDQLGHVAWYPLLQTEKDPVILRALTQGIRRHYRIVWAEKPSFYTFVYATVDPHQADIPRAIENLQEIPTDRRTWEQKNMHRADVTVSWRPNRFGRPVLTRALPADERIFEKWNADPYVPDDGGDGRVEDDGAAYLLPYWMGRYHGFISESQ